MRVPVSWVAQGLSRGGERRKRSWEKNTEPVLLAGAVIWCHMGGQSRSTKASDTDPNRRILSPIPDFVVIQCEKSV